ncbi:hypothetical protein Ocin01_19378, partial [Orchesella cincta]
MNKSGTSGQTQVAIDSDQDKIPDDQGETLEIFTSDSESELGAFQRFRKSSEGESSIHIHYQKRRKRKKTSSDSSTSSSSDSDTSESEFQKKKEKIAKPTPSQKPNPNLILHSCRLCRDNPGFSSKELSTSIGNHP